MRLEIDIAEHHYNNIMALDSVSLGRVPYKGIIMYSINAIKHAKVLEQEPTIKNDLPHCQLTDEEIAKSFIEDVEAVKDQLPCGEQMDFPNTFDDFVKDYGFKDKDEVYTNGSELITVFRVKQWLEHISTTKNDLPKYCDHNICLKNEYNNIGCDDCEVTKSQEPTTKNDLGVDCISRADAIKAMQNKAKKLKNEDTINGLCGAVAILFNLPSVTPQPRKGHWKLVQRGKSIDVCCSNCEAVRIKGYAYNYTIDELNKEDINECFGSAEMRYCPNCGAKMEVQE